jgi:hypothetical protein
LGFRPGHAEFRESADQLAFQNHGFSNGDHTATILRRWKVDPSVTNPASRVPGLHRVCDETGSQLTD